MKEVIGFLVGIVFAVGLGLSGMTQPSKVIGFLDIFGQWDPALLFVMVGATAVYFMSFRFLRPGIPLLAKTYNLPTQTTLDKKLIGGAALFGIGWGLSGYCPGPAITSVGAFSVGAVVFMAAMLVGMVAFKAVQSD